MAKNRTFSRLVLPITALVIVSVGAEPLYKNIMFKKPERNRPVSIDVQRTAIFEKIRDTRDDPTELLTQTWNTTAQDWENFLNEVYVYDQSFNPTSYKLQVWTSDNTWQDTLVTTYTYNADDLPTQISSKLWVASLSDFDDYDNLTLTYNEEYLKVYYKQDNFFYQGWTSIFTSPELKDSTRITTQWNTDGTPFQDSIEIVDSSTAPYNLVNNTKIRYSYNPDTTLDAALLEGWDGSAWVPSMKVTLKYNTNGTVSEELYQEYDNNSWVNYYRYLYTYDANDSVTKDLLQLWENDAWRDFDQMLYTYTNGNLTNVLYQMYYLTQSWENQFQYTYTYDANNNLLTMVYQIWLLGSWVNNLKGTATYNANGDIKEEIMQSWYANAWVNAEKYTYSYGTGIVNPFNGDAESGKVAHVSWHTHATANAAFHVTLLQPATISLDIYDVKGNLVRSLCREKKMGTGNNRIPWKTTGDNGRPVASGIYLYKLTVDDLAVAGKIHLAR